MIASEKMVTPATDDCRLPSIVLVGAGNVATHLAKALRHALIGIVNRGEEGARCLSELTGVKYYTDFGAVRALAPDVVLISLADRALPDVVAAIGDLRHADGMAPLVLHTSGTMPKESLAPLSDRTGILYPLQTFSKYYEVDMRCVPFFNEAVYEADLKIIDDIAAAISTSVHHADAAHRKALHIAGVFANNFPNVLLECVQKILGKAGYTLEVVRPLLEATVSKAFEAGPHAAQTGPARRGDTAVLNEHIRALEPDMVKVYEVLSNLIMNLHK